MKRFLSVLLVVALMSFAFVGCSSEPEAPETPDAAETPETPEEPEKIVWKFGHLSNDDHLWNQTALKFAELVAEKTDGEIEVKVYPNEAFGNERDMI